MGLHERGYCMQPGLNLNLESSSPALVRGGFPVWQQSSTFLNSVDPAYEAHVQACKQTTMSSGVLHESLLSVIQYVY